MLKAIGERFVIEPYYEGNDTKIGHIYIPDSMADPEPSQGEVISAPEKYRELEGKYVIFHRFRSKPLFGSEYISLLEEDLVCELNEGKIFLFDHRVEFLVIPDWDSKYTQKSDLIYLPPVALEHNQPVMFGVIKDYSLNALNLLLPGDRVAMEPGKGNELALASGVFYIIPYENILAIVNG